MQLISDPSRVLPEIAAAMVWLGLNPTDTNALDENKASVMDCLMYLSQAAEQGELRYYNKKLLKEVAIENTQETAKIFSYQFTMQNLMDFAKSKDHRLEARTGRTVFDGGPEKPLVTTERNTLLTIIAVLCKEAKLDYSKAAKTAGLIQSMADRMSIRIGETTIENHLKKVPEALEARKK
jgi:hypothetical protein